MQRLESGNRKDNGASMINTSTTPFDGTHHDDEEGKEAKKIVGEFLSPEEIEIAIITQKAFDDAKAARNGGW